MSNKNYDEFDNLENEWAQAIVSNDAEAIGSFMSEEWVIVGETGVSERNGFLELIEAGDLTHDAMKGNVVRVRRYNDVAVVISRGTNSGMFKGTPFSSDEWITDIFVKQDGRWRCVHTHLTAAKAEPTT